MNRILWLIVLALSIIAAPLGSRAQDSSYSLNHAEVGVFADYFRLDTPNPAINFVGVGGRVGVNVHPNIQLEAEMSYDFKRNFTTLFSNGVNTQFVSTNLRPLTALFGPKFQIGTSGPVRAFITGKVGLVNFNVSNQNLPSGFKSSLGAITTGDTRFAAYPGAGIEGFWGPFGIRLEAGDEIYLDNGARNNLKITLGPTFRF
jgi:Outer membrane protein beta-barrel domain